MCAGALQGSKVLSSKEAEARVALLALMKARERGFGRACVFLDAKEVV